MTGNEAIALGAFEAGAALGAAYPGTPSTEIMENFSKFEGVYAEWSPNEKVALEVAIGAAIGGKRAFAAMKHVGLNVAADPLFTSVYTGIEAGLVIVTADDPGMYSSQNEQDNRYYALSSKAIMLEPSDSQESKDFTKLAFSISENLDLPVILRTTTRVSHSRSLVEKGKINEKKNEDTYQKKSSKYVMIPANARLRHQDLLKRLAKAVSFSEKTELNYVEEESNELGIITSGISYQYVKEIFPDVSILKLGLTHPLPRDLIERFCQTCNEIWVIEELEPYLEFQIRAMGIDLIGKDIIRQTGELSPDIIYKDLGNNEKSKRLVEKYAIPEIKDKEGLSIDSTDIQIRPPNLCPGCPHRGVFYVLKKLNPIITGDIGCYTLSVLPPLEAMDTCICMGAGVSAAHGIEKSGSSGGKKVVAVIGDSTFIHSGITPLIDIYYNKGTSLVIVLDNRTTAMTGRQDHPGTGVTLQGEAVEALDFAKIAKAIGIEIVEFIDPYNLEETENTISRCLKQDSPSLLITNRPCILIEKTKESNYIILDEKCNNCNRCLRLGCPAISSEDDEIVIDKSLCTSCDLCLQLCNFEAIVKEDIKNERK